MNKAVVVLVWNLVVVTALSAQPLPPGDGARGEVRRGLLRNEPGAYQGYTLFAPLSKTTTYLVDLRGDVVHRWESRYNPGNSAYLLPDGSLLRAARDPHASFRGGGIGGRIQKYDWDGNLIWDYAYADEKKCHHHDIEPLPNGNVLVLAWELKTREEAMAAGRKPETIREGGVLWPDHVVEVEPQGLDGGRVVWAWHSWDHLVQDFDSTKANYGKVEDHPGRIDVNYDRGMTRLPRPEIQRLRGLGYIGGDDPDAEETDRGEGDRRRPPGGFPGGPPGGGFGGGPDGGGADWHHTNAIDYHPRLDQIVLSVLGFNELWIIDHSTTTVEAAGRSGGRAGRGGDLLYRWGNPQAYRRGNSEDQRLFGQHDVQWIEEGLPGAGHLLIFNNGRGRPEGEFSSVDELAPPVDSKGNYVCPTNKPFGPDELFWRYTAGEKRSFFSGHISGAQRLPNGNTLICAGEQGLIFEVNRDHQTVWEYRNPYLGEAVPTGPFGRPRPGPTSTNGSDAQEGPPPSEQVGDADHVEPLPSGDSSEADRRDAPQARGGGRRPTGVPGFPPGGGPAGPGMGGGRGPGSPEALFRATRIPADDPGLSRLKTAPPPSAASSSEKPG